MWPSPSVKLPTEDQDVAVRVAHFELPVSVALLLQWELDESLVTYTLVQRSYPSHPDIRVPQTLRSTPGEVGLLIASEPEQHDLRIVALKTCIDVGLDVGKSAGGAKAEVFTIPSRSAADI